MEMTKMKKLNITKEQFEKSKYFKNKYGTLKYISESGKTFKTSKGNILRFVKESIGDDLSIEQQTWFADLMDEAIEGSKAMIGNDRGWGNGADDDEEIGMYDADAEANEGYIEFLQYLRDKYCPDVD